MIEQTPAYRDRRAEALTLAANQGDPHEATLVGAVNDAREATAAVDQHYVSPLQERGGLRPELIGGDLPSDPKLEVVAGGDYRGIRATQTRMDLDGTKTHFYARVDNDSITGGDKATVRRVGPDGKEVYSRSYDDPKVARKLATVIAKNVTRQAEVVRSAREEA